MPLASSIAEVILNSATHVSIIATDLTGTITVFNRGAELLLGYPSEEMVGRETPERFHDPAEVEARGAELSAQLGRPIRGFDVFVEHARQGLHEEREWTYLGREGKRLRVNLVVTGLRDSEGELVGFLGVAIDVTARREADEALARSQDQVSDILEHSGLLIQSVGPDGAILYVNRVWCDTLGYSREEVLGLNIFELIQEDERADCLGKFQRMLAGEKPGPVEVTFVTREGRRIRLEGSINCSFERGVPQHTRGYFRDVTQIETLRNRYDLFFKTSLDLLCIASPEGYFLRVNPAWTQTLGYSQEELISQPFLSFVHPEDRARTEQEAARLGGGGSTVGFENRYRCRDGSYRWLLWSASASREEGLILATARDITDRIQLETRLRDEREQTRAILENLAEGVVSIDESGRIHSVNPAAERIFGYSEAELGGKNVSMLMPEPHSSRHDGYLERYLREGVPRIIGIGREVEGLRRDGSLFPMELAVGEVRSDRGVRVFAGIIRDVTARKQAEREMREARRSAELASQAKSGFLATMSHELRTPLNAIIGFSEVLVDQKFGELNPRQQRYLENILHSGRHLLGLINEVLDLSKIEAGKTELDLLPVRLHSALTEALHLTEGMASPRRVQLHLEPAPADFYVRADPSRLKQVLLNLLSNAVKFTLEGGSICLRQDAVGVDQVRISVCDTGIGIAPEDQTRIFHAFEQVDSSYARAQTGTGLGLSLTRHLVELHGGEIGVQSDGPGRGSTFWFTLPRAHSPDEAGVPRAQSRDLVLIVEDDPAAAELLSHHLGEGGFTVHHCPWGAMALELAAGLNPVAITLDVVLPDLDGWAVLRLLKADERTRAIPVVMVSMTEDRSRGIAMGATEFLTKPVRGEVICGAVRQAVLGPARVLLISSDPVAVERLTESLNHSGYQVSEAGSAARGLELALEETPEAIMLDLFLSGATRLEVARRLKQDQRTRAIPLILFGGRALTEQEREQLSLEVRGAASATTLDDMLVQLANLLGKRKHENPPG